ncbi:Na+/H+ antiporter subunit E [Aquipuribacter sp. SD81]|uniref:Na+/H+ antiporter subunit E n=1 Tax=Aquipuribacter sp. SD81 TaxID=3127703 RepID=UPI0030192FAE
MSGPAGAHLARAGRLLRFAGWFLGELTRANVQVTWDVLTPTSRLEPGVVALPLRCRTDLEVALLSGLVTLTPGTLTLAVREPAAEGGGTMWVHGMYSPDADAFRRELDDLQRRMLRAMRLEGAEDLDNPESPESPEGPEGAGGSAAVTT